MNNLEIIPNNAATLPTAIGLHLSHTSMYEVSLHNIEFKQVNVTPANTVSIEITNLYDKLTLYNVKFTNFKQTTTNIITVKLDSNFDSTYYPTESRYLSIILTNLMISNCKFDQLYFFSLTNSDTRVITSNLAFSNVQFTSV